jgi:hypothetical protein
VNTIDVVVKRQKNNIIEQNGKIKE